MATDGNGKPKSNFTSFWANMTPEVKAEFLANRLKKIKAGNAKRTEEMLKLQELKRQREMAVGSLKELPIVKKIKNELYKMTDKNYVPEWDAINAAITLTKQGKDLDQIRKEFFPHTSQDIWVKFKKCMFATQITSPEDVGNDLLVARDVATSEIKREIEKMRELQKDRPQLYHQHIIRALSAIQQIHSDTAKRLVDIGAVGSKRSGGISVQIVNYIPRPDKPLAHDKKTHTQYITTAPKELDLETIDVTPKKEKAKA